MNCTLTDANVYLLELNCRRRMAETKGRGGCSRDGKLRGMGPPSSCLSIWGISVCAIRLGLRSLEDGRPRDGWRRDGCPRDGCTRDGGRPRRMPLRRMSPRRRKAETEEDRDGCPRDGRYVFLNIMEGLSACYCLICFNGVFGLMKAVVCVRVGGWLGVNGCVWWRTGWQ